MLPAGQPAALAEDEAVTLRLAVSDAPARPSQSAIDTFVTRAAELSNGSVRIEPTYNAGADTPEGFEAGVAGLVERGDADLGLVASRAWDLAGITSLQALQAPFLITDDALAAAVAASPIAEDLLAGMAPAGVTGLALWPEDLRHPFSFVPGEPLVSPEDFAGDSILVQPSALSQLLVTTLGATVFPADRDRVEAVAAGELQGAESGLLQGQSLPGTPTATGDVVFYPKFQVLVANSAALAKLSESQRTALREAAIATRDGAIAGHTAEADAAAAWCDAGGSVVLAGPEGIAAFEAAARPVFDAIAADPVTATAISAIRELATTVEPAPGATACGPDGAAGPSEGPSAGPDLAGFTGSSLPPDGSYRNEATVGQLIAGGATERYAKANAGISTVTIRDGTFSIESQNADGLHSCSASAVVAGDRVRLTTTTGPGPAACGITYDLVWRLEGDRLYIVVVGSPEPGWTDQDLRNELAWKDIPLVRID
jgi:TRAP-type C4-dicarboxylate transport system substrate-binding protein